MSKLPRKKTPTLKSRRSLNSLVMYLKALARSETARMMNIFMQSSYSNHAEAIPVAQRPRPVAYYLQEPLKKCLEKCVDEC